MDVNKNCSNCENAKKMFVRGWGKGQGRMVGVGMSGGGRGVGSWVG